MTTKLVSSKSGSRNTKCLPNSYTTEDLQALHLGRLHVSVPIHCANIVHILFHFLHVPTDLTLTYGAIIVQIVVQKKIFTFGQLLFIRPFQFSSLCQFSGHKGFYVTNKLHFTQLLLQRHMSLRTCKVFCDGDIKKRSRRRKNVDSPESLISSLVLRRKKIMMRTMR